MNSLKSLSLLATNALVMLFSMLGSAQNFNFAAFGDTGYQSKSEANVTQLIDTINNYPGLDFIVHVGDTMGLQSCTTQSYARVLGWFNSVNIPLMYIPGDNEWTDCAAFTTLSNGDRFGKEYPLRDPLSALTEIRNTFFIQPGLMSLGQHTTNFDNTLERQNSLYVENQRWVHNNIQFVSLHIVGSADDCRYRTVPGPLDLTNPNPYFPYYFQDINRTVGNGSNIPTSCSTEMQNRQQANLTWLHDTFTKAKNENRSAVVVFAQANLLFVNANEDQSCLDVLIKRGLAGTCEVYKPYRLALRNESLDFQKPVVLIHGDYHVFSKTTPMHEVPNFTDVQVPAVNLNTEPNTPKNGWIIVNVDDKNKGLFKFTPGTLGKSQ